MASCSRCGGKQQPASHRLTFTTFKSQTYVPDGRTAKVFFRTSMDIEDAGTVQAFQVSQTYRIGYDLIAAILKYKPRVLRFMIPTEQTDFLKQHIELKKAV